MPFPSVLAKGSPRAVLLSFHVCHLLLCESHPKTSQLKTIDSYFLNQWLSWVALAQGLSRLQSQRLPRLQPSQGCPGLEGVLLWWLLQGPGERVPIMVGGLPSSPREPPLKTAGVSLRHDSWLSPEQVIQERARWKPQCPLWPGLEGHTPTFPQSLVSYAVR